MKVMVIVKASPSSEAGVMPSEELMAEMGAYNQKLIDAGIMLAGEGLHPTSRGYRVRFSGANRTVVRGPFTETNELIAGYWLWKVQSIEEALEWVKQCPNPMLEDSEIEIRQVYDMEDFGEVMTPELKEQDLGQRAKLAGLGWLGIQDSSERKLLGVGKKYSAETRFRIPEQWHQFVGMLPQLQGNHHPETYGLITPVSGCSEIHYLTGVEPINSSNTPQTFTSGNIPAGNYAVFAHEGHVSKIPDTMQKIGEILSESGYSSESGISFEKYTAKFDPMKGTGGIEIWVSI